MNLYPNLATTNPANLIKSTLDISFLVPFDIPMSRAQNKTSEEVSYLIFEVSPSGGTSINNDLGYSSPGTDNSIPCIQITGLVPVVGYTIDCFIDVIYPKIYVKNYEWVKKGSTVRILVPDYTNPAGNFNLQIYVVSKVNRVHNPLGTKQETLTVVTGTPTLLDYSGVSSTGFYTVTVQEVSNTFDLTFDLSTTSNILGGEKMVIKLPFYDTGFVPSNSYASVKVLVND
jgi:hypothetical protein